MVPSDCTLTLRLASRLFAVNHHPIGDLLPPSTLKPFSESRCCVPHISAASGAKSASSSLVQSSGLFAIWVILSRTTREFLAFRISSGSLTMFAAIRRASSRHANRRRGKSAYRFGESQYSPLRRALADCEPWPSRYHGIFASSQSGLAKPSSRAQDSGNECHRHRSRRLRAVGHQRR